MRIASNWKITFDPAGTPLVLLAVGDEIDSELRCPIKRGLDTVALVDSPIPFLRPTGNSQFAIKLNIYTYTSLDTSARAAMFDSLIAIDALGRKPLRIEISGIPTYYYQFANAYVTDHDPGRDPDGVPAGVVKSYAIVATGLSKITP